MSWLKLARAYRPRRAAGLPKGQREVRAFPRFSDEPLRWAPAPGEASLAVSVRGEVLAEVGPQLLATLDRVERSHDFHCVTTWTYRDVGWGGWTLTSLLGEAGIDVTDLPRYARVVAGDDRHAVFLTEDLLATTVIVADQLDAEPLPRRHGGPLRLVAPDQYGYKSVKHLVSIEFVDEQPAGSYGPKEHLRARVALEERHATRPNWLLRVPYRLTIVPTALAAEVGLKRSPD